MDNIDIGFSPLEHYPFLASLYRHVSAVSPGQNLALSPQARLSKDRCQIGIYSMCSLAILFWLPTESTAHRPGLLRIKPLWEWIETPTIATNTYKNLRAGCLAKQTECMAKKHNVCVCVCLKKASAVSSTETLDGAAVPRRAHAYTSFMAGSVPPVPPFENPARVHCTLYTCIVQGHRLTFSPRGSVCWCWKGPFVDLVCGSPNCPR